MDIEKHSGTTDVKGYTFSYKWMINNFNICDQEVGESISSPSFYASSYPNIEWFLDIYPRGMNEENKEHVSIFLCNRTKDNSKVKAIFNFCIIDIKMDRRFQAEAAHTFSGKENALGFGKFVSRTNLFTPIVTKILVDNVLTILCTITMGVKIENLSKESLDVFCENENKFMLPTELESLLENKKLMDLTLVSASGKHLYAHKAVLAARSPVFLAMLQNNMKEKESGKIVLADVSFDLLTEILQYMYTDNVKNIEKYSKDLVCFADKYDMKGLKLICEKHIYNELSIINAVETLITAESYNCEILKSHVLKFILKHAKDIVKTSQFTTLKKDLPSLVVDMINAQTYL